MLNKIKSYLKELTIVTIGVLIALLVSNIKENKEAKRYYDASIETINTEVKSNYSSLKGVIEKQKNLQDTLMKYGNTSAGIGEIIAKSGGLKIAGLNNNGIDLYKRNEINRIDIEMMSNLNDMHNKSKVISTKADRLIDFAYSNFIDNSKENKTILFVHIRDILDTEESLLKVYKDYIDKNIIKNTIKN